MRNFVEPGTKDIEPGTEGTPWLARRSVANALVGLIALACIGIGIGFGNWIWGSDSTPALTGAEGPCAIVVERNVCPSNAAGQPCILPGALKQDPASIYCSVIEYRDGKCSAPKKSSALLTGAPTVCSGLA